MAPLLLERGTIVLDVVHGRIMFVEVLDRPPFRTTSGPEHPPKTNDSSQKIKDGAGTGDS